jgi:superfamily II DNA or RNA helicase
VFEKSVGLYIGGMKEEQLKESETKKIIIATYAMASEGLDIKTLTTLCMATPKTDVCQSVGRILRSKHKRPLVIDIVDKHDIFQRQFNKRKTYYNKKKYNIQKYQNLTQYINNDFIRVPVKTKKEKSQCLINIPESAF